MGNRAVIQVEGSKVGVYLHWNGGIESVTAFLRAANDLGVRDPMEDTPYFYARFTQIIGNFFGGTASVGIGLMSELDTKGNNGVYIVGHQFRIVGRKCAPKVESLNEEKEKAIYAEVMEANQAIFE